MVMSQYVCMVDGTAARMSARSRRSTPRSWASSRAVMRALTSATTSAGVRPCQTAASCATEPDSRSAAARASSAWPASARTPSVGWLVSSTRGSASTWMRRPRGSSVK